MAAGSGTVGVPLSEVSVRPVAGGAERAEWDRLMDAHHYLGFRCLFGGGVRHVAQTADGRWLALLGWQCGAFKVKARDAWIGWAPEQQFRRLRLVANNTRFLILPGARTRNLASRALSLSVRRLSSDMEAALGHPALVAETFVDPSRFEGTCYRASNWVELGETRGYAKSHGEWVAHGRPKRVFARPLAPGALEALRGLDEPAPPPASGAASASEPPAPARLRSLYDFLRQVPECRRRRGLRHALATVLAVSVAAKLAGARGPTAIAEFAARLTQRQLAAVRAFRSPATGRLAPPSKSCVHRVLSELDPDALDDAARRFAAAGRPDGGAIAVDGKSAPLNRPGGPDADRMFVAAVEHGSGVVRGQVGSDSAGGEIVGVRRLLSGIGVAGRVVTMDALHCCPNTARLIVDGGGDYVVEAKANHQTLLDDIRILDWEGAPSRRTVDKGHGRLEERTCAVVPLDGVHDDVAALPGRRQAFRIVRRRTVVKSGKTAEETVHGVTSLPRGAPARPRSSPSTAGTGRSRTASTTSATSPSTRTARASAPASCHATSPASPTSPSPSCACGDASSTSPRRTATTPPNRPRRCATSSLRSSEPTARRRGGTRRARPRPTSAQGLERGPNRSKTRSPPDSRAANRPISQLRRRSPPAANAPTATTGWPCMSEYLAALAT